MTIIRTRRGTSAAWTAANPVLDSGEVGYDTTAGKFKVGDAVTAWAGLPYFLESYISSKITAPADPNADRILFWDDSAGVFTHLSVTAPLVITGTAMTISAASEAASGQVELATAAETATGTDTTRAIHPAGLKPLLTAKVSKGERWANVVDYLAVGRVPGTTDDRAAFESARATGRPVYAPAGTYWFSSSPDWGAGTILVGDGKRKTIFKLLDTATADANLIVNPVMTGTVQMYFADFTLDGNCQRQGGVLVAAGGSRSSTFTLRNVQHAYVDRVESINSIQHGFDVTRGHLDYAYVGDGNLATLRSSHVYFDQCEASNFGDDGFTTHSSDYVYIARSVAFSPRLRGNCNGIEVDGDSRYCTLTTNRTFNCYAGIEIKGHGTESAAMYTEINGHIDSGSVRSYNFRHIGYQTGADPVSLSAFGITATNLVSIDPNNDAGFQDDATPRALSISAYQGVVINGFLAKGRGGYGAGAIAVQVQYRASAIISGLSVTGWAGADLDVSLTTSGSVTLELDVYDSAQNSVYTGATIASAVINISRLKAPAGGGNWAFDIYNSTNVEVSGLVGVTGYAVPMRADLINYPSVAHFMRRTRDLPAGTTLLAGLDLTKDYYGSSGAMGSITDGPGLGGANFITHTRLSADATVQTLTRNTTTEASQGMAWRVVYTNATAGPWNINAQVKDALDIPGGTTLLTSLNLARSYYGTTAMMGSITDGPGLGGANFITHERVGGDEVIQTVRRNSTVGGLQGLAWRIVYISNLTTGPWNHAPDDEKVKVLRQSTNADDTALAQALLDQCAAEGGGEVLVPFTGTVWRFGKLYISRNTTFRCAPGVVIKRKGATYGISNVVAGVNPLANNNDPYSGHGDIRIIGGVWDGNIVAESYVASGFNHFYFAGARNILIEGVTVLDMVTNHAVDLNGVSDVVIRDCRFLGYKDATTDSSRGYVEAIQCSQNMDNSDAAWYPMMGFPSKNVLVDKCLFGASGTAGTIAFPAGFGTHTSTNDALSENLTVRNSRFEGCGFAGVVPYTYNDMKVLGNTFIGCSYGVRANNFSNGKTWDAVNNVWTTGGATRKETSGLQVLGNRFVDTIVTDVSVLGTSTDAGGFWAAMTDVTIGDNQMKATTATKRTGQNIRTLLCRKVTVRDNICENGQVGILVDSCGRANVHDNYVHTTQTYGIQLTKGSTPTGTDATLVTGCRVVNNHVENAGSHGIGNNTMYFSLVQGNTVIDWGRVTAASNGILTSATNESLVSGNSLRNQFTGIGAAIYTATTSTSNVAVTYDNRIVKADGALITIGTGTNNTYGNLTYAVT